MFFNKKIRKIEKEMQAEHEEFLRATHIHLEKIGGVTDIGDKIFVLENVLNNIKGTKSLVKLVEAEQKKIVRMSSAITANVAPTGGAIGFMGLGFCLAGLWLAAPFAIGGMAAMGIVLSNESTEKRCLKATQDFIATLNNQNDRVAETIEQLLQDSSLEKIAASARSKELCRQYPVIRDRFAAAAAAKELSESRGNVANCPPPNQP